MLTRSEFLEVSRVQLGHMRAQYKPKYTAAGKLTRPGREIPFELPEYRDWMLATLTTQDYKCKYCGKELTRKNIAPDHIVPAKRGGSLALTNLCICCRHCNVFKDELSLQSFRALVKGLKSFPEEDRKNIIGRIRRGSVRHFMRFVDPNKQPVVKPQPAQQKLQALRTQEDF